MAHRLLVIRMSGRLGRRPDRPGTYARMERDAVHEVMAGPPLRGWLI